MADTIMQEAERYYMSRFGTVDAERIDALIEDDDVPFETLRDIADENIASAIAVMEAFDTYSNSNADTVREELQDMALSVDLLSVTGDGACTWSILLGTGGPADRVIVATTMDGEIETAEYQYQDWFTPWTTPQNQDRGLVERFASLFYIGTVMLTVDGIEL